MTIAMLARISVRGSAVKSARRRGASTEVNVFASAGTSVKPLSARAPLVTAQPAKYIVLRYIQGTTVLAEQLTPADYERLAALRYMLRRFANFSAGAAQQAGLTTNQHQALLAIKGWVGEAMTVGALAEQLLIAPHTAAELGGRLQAADLVDKVEDAVDRRRVVLRLTERAETILQALTLVHLREVRLFAPRLMTLFKDLDALLE